MAEELDQTDLAGVDGEDLDTSVLDIDALRAKRDELQGTAGSGTPAEEDADNDESDEPDAQADDEPDAGEPADDDDQQEAVDVDGKQDGRKKTPEEVAEAARKSYYKAVEDRKRLETEKRELEKKLLEKELATAPKPLSKEELKALMYDDPDAAMEYLERSKQTVQTAEMQKRHEQLTQDEMQDRFLNDVQTFAKLALGKDDDVLTQEEFDSFLRSKEYESTAKFLDANYFTKGRAKEVSPEFMLGTYFRLNRNLLTAKARAEAAATITQNIKSAAKNGSHLNKLPGAKGSHTSAFERWTDQDIARAGFDELKAYNKWLTDNEK